MHLSGVQTWTHWPLHQDGIDLHHITSKSIYFLYQHLNLEYHPAMPYCLILSLPPPTFYETRSAWSMELFAADPWSINQLIWIYKSSWFGFLKVRPRLPLFYIMDFKQLHEWKILIYEQKDFTTITRQFFSKSTFSLKVYQWCYGYLHSACVPFY